MRSELALLIVYLDNVYASHKIGQPFYLMNHNLYECSEKGHACR